MLPDENGPRGVHPGFGYWLVYGSIICFHTSTYGTIGFPPPVAFCAINRVLRGGTALWGPEGAGCIRECRGPDTLCELLNVELNVLADLLFRFTAARTR